MEKKGDPNGRSSWRISMVEIPKGSVEMTLIGRSSGWDKARLNSAIVSSNLSKCNSAEKAMVMTMLA
jgi:hypothetical protein